MANKFDLDMDTIDLSSISLDGLDKLPDLPSSENDWKKKSEQDTLDISNLDMGILNIESPVLPEDDYKYDEPEITEKAVPSPAASVPLPAAPKPVSGLPAGYVPPKGGITVGKKSDVPELKPAVSSGISVEKKPAAPTEPAQAPAASGAAAPSKIPVTVGGASGISVEKKSVTIPGAASFSASKPVSAPVSAPVEEPEEYDQSGSLDDLPMPVLSGMDGEAAAVKKAPVQQKAPAAPAKPSMSDDLSARSISGADAKAEARKRNLDAGFEDQPIRVSQLSHQATIDAQMQEFENQRRKQYEDGRTIVMIISIIYGVLSLCSFLDNISFRAGITLAIRIYLAYALFKGSRKVRRYYVVVSVVSAIYELVSVVSVINMAKSLTDVLGEGSEQAVSAAILILAVICVIDVLYSIITSAILTFNKKVNIYFESL